MSVSPRTWLELVTGGALLGLLVWQLLTAADLRTQRAELKTRLADRELVLQAETVTARTCQGALTSVQSASGQLAQATQEAYATADRLRLAATSRDQAVAKVNDQLLRVRAGPGQDCQVATGLARGAWEDGR